ncbi:hypothetical protein BBP40_002959 [Aspergillus hancockii]|nr:hypothetical protein BBP40_002959 [Aspergillus hancockii]
MALNPRRKLIWQRVIPDFASKKPYLMHLLLGLAGLHVLTSQAESDQSLEANQSPDIQSSSPDFSMSVDLPVIIHHHQLGLQGFRDQLSHLTDANEEEVLTGSFLLVGFALASLCVQDLDPNLSPGENTVLGQTATMSFKPRLDWLYLVRGCSSVIQQRWNTLKMGRLRHMFFYQYANDDWKAAPEPSSFPRIHTSAEPLYRFVDGARHAIMGLQDFLTRTKHVLSEHTGSLGTPSSQGSTSAVQDRATSVLEENSRALETLESMYMRILYVVQFCKGEQICSADAELQTDIEDTAVISWPHLLSSEYICSLDCEEIGLPDGLSFTVLAHFYVIFSLFKSLWYLKHSVDKELAKIDVLVRSLGNEQLSNLMQWPLGVVGYQTPVADGSR